MTRLPYSDIWQGIARLAPERPAIISGDTATTAVMTWARFAAEAGALARRFSERGLGRGDAVALLMHNRAEFLTTTWACFAIGASPVALNYRYRAAEVRALLLDSAARVLVAPTSFGEVVAEAVRGLDIEVVEIDNGGVRIDGAVRYTDIIRRVAALPAEAPRGAQLRLYTGGTTGTPKAVVWDLDALLVARRFSTWGAIGVAAPDTVERAVAIAVDSATPPIVTLPLSPLLHGTAQSTTFGALTLGGTVVLQGSASVDVEQAHRLIVEHGVTRITVAGDVLALPLAEVGERRGGLGRVRWIFSSGMRFSDEVKGRLHRLGDIEIIDMLATSEGGPFAFGITRGARDLPARFTLTPDAVLLDEDDVEVSLVPGAIGILGFRGILPTGYYRDPVKTAETFRQIGAHRYIVPGDWARARGDGTIELLGRLSAVVNTGGEKVFPAEVEEVLLQHPAVGDAVVFGLPDDRFGEVVSAAITPAAGTEVDVAALLAFVGARLAGFKKPRHVFVRASLHRSLTGKVALARLKEDAMRDLAVTP